MSKLGKPERNGNGFRWKKTYRKQRFISSTFHSPSRDNQRKAWNEFKEWKDSLIELTENDKIKIYVRQQIADIISDLPSVEKDIEAGLKDHLERYEHELKLRLLADQSGFDLDEKRKERLKVLESSGGDFTKIPQHTLDQVLLSDLNGEPVEDNKLVKFWKEKFYKFKESKNISAGAIANITTDVERFTKFIGNESSVDKIDSISFESFCVEILKRNFADSTKLNIISRTKSFVEYLYKHKAIKELPRNINDFKPEVETTKNSHFKPEEIEYILKNTSGHLKCFVHLMANCGMTQKDIADLKTDELQNGYIIRKRSKKRKGENIPEVKWKLWKSTIDLIEIYRTDKDGLLFTMPRTHRKWYLRTTTIVDGKRKNSAYDPIRKLYDRWKKNHPQRYSLKTIRATSSDLLCDIESYQEMFLCHSPKGIGLKHYYDLDQNKFDSFIIELGSKYNL